MQRCMFFEAQGCAVSLFSRHLSYTEKVLTARKRRRAIGRAIGFLLFIAFVRTFFIQSYKVTTASMQPALATGDLVLASPAFYGPKTIFGKLAPVASPGRGELVVVSPDALPIEGKWFRLWDAAARFFSFQRFSPLAVRYGRDFSSYCICRVVGIPGDTLRLNGSIFEIKPKGSRDFASEFALVQTSYAITPGRAAVTTDVPGAEFPMTETTLREGEYFVAFDDRTTLSGSLLWGPISTDRLAGKVVAIYWPFRHFRLP